jgi:hypothetical protein
MPAPKKKVSPALSAKRRAAGRRGAAIRFGLPLPPDEPLPPTPERKNLAQILAELPKSSDSEDPKAIVVETLGQLRTLIKQCDPDDIPKIANAITAQSNLLAKLTGSLEVSQVMLLRSKAWGEFMGLIERTLEPYPQVLAALRKAFEPFK